MKSIRENLSLIAAIAGAIAVLVAYLLKADEKVVYNIILLATILIVVIAILVKSYFDTNKDQNILYSFLTDNLLPNKSKKFLGIKTDIVIIEDKESQSIFENFRKQFQKMPELKITHFICDSSDRYLQKDNLRHILFGAEAVIVVRTKELEKKSWVYESLETWAFQNSHVPCLVIDKIDSNELEQLKLSPIPEKYFFIPDDKISLPWRLLKRANERAFAWRNQASFNRLIAMSVFILLLTGLMISYFTSSLQRNEYEKLLQSQKNDYDNLFRLLQNQRSDYDNLLREISNGGKDYHLLKKIYKVIAKQTKDQYEYSVMNIKDSKLKDVKLNVSYWFNYNGTLYQLATTDDHTDDTTFGNNKGSIIGCAFAYPNHIVGRDNIAGQTMILAFNEEPSPDVSTCEYGKEKDRKLKYLICSSYSKTGSPEDTVGICVFTESENNILGYDYRKFLKDRTVEFSIFVDQLIKDKRLIPQ